MSARARAPGLGAVAVLVALAGCLGEPTDAGEPVATDRVVIPGPWVFEPRAVVVAPGTEVTWTNDGGAAHTVTFRDLPIDAKLEPGASASFRFDEPGRYEYVCVYHPPDMAGTLVVEAAA